LEFTPLPVPADGESSTRTQPLSYGHLRLPVERRVIVTQEDAREYFWLAEWLIHFAPKKRFYHSTESSFSTL